MERRRLRPAMEAVRKRMWEWRDRRPKPNRIPEEIWVAAVLLTEEHGIGRVAHELGLNYSTLKERVRSSNGAMVEAGREGDVRHSGGEPVGCEDGPAFVELDAAQLFVTPPLGASVTLTAADGATMTIQLPSGHPLDLAALASSFWRRGA